VTDNDTTTGPPTATAQLAEATLVARAQDGDLAAFEVLVRRYQPSIYRLAYRLVLDRCDAEDATQDTLIQAWRRLPTLADPEAFRGWLYRIATHRCLSLIRLQARRRTSVVEESELELGRPVQVRPDDDPARMAERSIEVSSLAAALRELPEDQRACWVLCELHELSYAEIGYAVGVPVATVRGRLARARQNLAKGMATWR
jgi:RNA polymerase sigma-70 factor (ECF subfamily)